PQPGFVNNAVQLVLFPQRRKGASKHGVGEAAQSGAGTVEQLPPRRAVALFHPVQQPLQEDGVVVHRGTSASRRPFFRGFVSETPRSPASHVEGDIVWAVAARVFYSCSP